MSNILEKIEVVEFPDYKYYQEIFPKKQLVIHHTVSNPKSPMGPIKYWISQKGHVATPFVIDFDGDIKQCLSSKYWCHHLGVKSKDFEKYGLQPNNVKLNKESIGIELCNWGNLEKKSDGFYNAYGKKIEDDLEIVTYPDKYKGCIYYQKYSDKQINSLKELLILLANKFDIPMDYNYDMWDVSIDALNGKPGIWTHTSFRDDKFDCHPQEELKDMLKGLDPL